MRIWTTANQAASEQYSYWREVVCEAFTALEPVTRSRRDFTGTVFQRDYSSITVNDTISKAQSILRRPKDIDRDPAPHFFACVQLSGLGVLRQDGREILLRPGDFHVTDITRPYELQVEDWRLICCKIPYHLLAPLLADSRRPGVMRVDPRDSAVAAVAASYIRMLNQLPETIEPERRALYGSSLINLVALAMGDGAGPSAPRPPSRAGLLAAILGHVDTHIADPKLSAVSVAAAFRISPRYLHKLFETHGRPFGQTVLKLRLDHCARDLASPGANRTVTEIAYGWGFGDLSHFCRLFRQAYGVSAREFRQQRWTASAKDPTG